MFANGEPGRKTVLQEIQDALADCDTVHAWLKERGYGSALEAVAAGEIGPALRSEDSSLARYVEIEHQMGRGLCEPIE
jgi:hypothetical protein